MSTLLKAILFLGFIFSTNFAHADSYWARLGLMYLSANSDASGTTVKTNRTLMDFGLGGVTQSGWAYGVLYATEKSDNGNGASYDLTSMGLSGGYMPAKETTPYVLFSYLLSAKNNPNEGTGYRFDFGYKYTLRKFALALQFSYKQFTFTKNNGVPLDPQIKTGNIDPYFVLMFDF